MESKLPWNQKFVTLDLQLENPTVLLTRKGNLDLFCRLSARITDSGRGEIDSGNRLGPDQRPDKRQQNGRLVFGSIVEVKLSIESPNMVWRMCGLATHPPHLC